MKKKSWVLLTIVCLLVCFGLARVYYRFTDDFRSGNYMHQVPHHAEWEITALPLEEQAQLDTIFAQKYYYLGKGAQSFAFLSQDGNHVLKLFKFKHLKPSWLIELLPPVGLFKRMREEEKERKYLKLESVFNGYQLAYDLHKRDSGLLFVHLNKDSGPGKKVRVQDKINLWHELDLNELIYVLQKKAVTTRQEMINLLSRGDVSTAIQRVNQIFDLYLTEYAKGIYDRDHGVMHNTGFVHESASVYPIHLDIGKLSPNESMKQVAVYRPDLEKVVYKFNLWFSENYPQYYSELRKAMEGKLSTIFGEGYNVQPLRT